MKIDRLLFKITLDHRKSFIYLSLLKSSNVDCSRNNSNFSKRFYSSKQEKPQSKDVDKFENISEKNIRNFSIIAHVDHGKSTLADRMLEMTGAMKIQPGSNQVLDRLQVERERGITVKAQTASLLYNHNGEDYLLNLIDTPGHVDFSNEVSRSLAACQGVILLVDANQGVQAQTVANFYLAFTKELVIIPVLNKVDLKNADPDGVTEQLNTLFSIDPVEVLRVSAKLGTGVNELLATIIERIPPPTTDRTAPLQALIFDSWYDKYKGAIALVYLREGQMKTGDDILSVYTKNNYTVRSLGVLRPFEEQTNKLSGGQVGYVICNMRTTKEACIGDTLCLKSMEVQPLESFTPPKPMVYAGVYPMDQSEHPSVRAAIEKLTLNDAAVTVTKDTSPALGQGWRLGFLGLLHMEVFNQRLEQEHNAQVIMAAPSVTYKVKIFGKKNIAHYGDEVVNVSNPAHWPDPTITEEIYEPIVIGTIITPDIYVSKIVSLCVEKRGSQKNYILINDKRIMLQFYLPLNEIIVDFHDRLKSVSSGFASFDYEDHEYTPSNLVKMEILLNGTPVQELSTIVHTSKVSEVGKKLVKKLAELIPRQMIQIAIQAAVGGKIYARETLKPYRKDVTAKLYGGDVTRRMKLLKQQSEGKKKMKMVANINVPRDTFIEVLKRSD